MEIIVHMPYLVVVPAGKEGTDKRCESWCPRRRGSDCRWHHVPPSGESMRSVQRRQQGTSPSVTDDVDVMDDTAYDVMEEVDLSDLLRMRMSGTASTISSEDRPWNKAD